MLVIAAPLALTVAAGCSGSGDESADESDEGALKKGCPKGGFEGKRLSEGEIAALVRSAGFPESAVGTAVCTAIKESNRYTRAFNNNCNGTTDYGLFQINSINLEDGTRGCSADEDEIWDPIENVKCAKALWSLKKSFSPWYGYKSHQSECDRYPAPKSVALTSVDGGVPLPPPRPDAADFDAATPEDPNEP